MAIEDDIKALAERNAGKLLDEGLAESREQLAPFIRSPHQPGRFGRSGQDVVKPPTATAVQERIAELIKRAQALASVAEGIEGHLAGPPANYPLKDGYDKPGPGTVFSRQMVQLDELAKALDALGRSLERSNGALT